MTLEEDITEIKQILTEIKDHNAEASLHLVGTAVVIAQQVTDLADSLRIFREFVLEVTPEQAKKDIKEVE